jgi:AP-4 complex subunit epsilon-1
VNEANDPITAAVQEACLVAMLRVSAHEDAIPQEAIAKVQVLAATAGRHLRRVSENSKQVDVSPAHLLL